MKGYLYILLCADGSFYTGSTNDLERRLEEHQNGEGANHTRKRLPVELVYTEEYDRIDEAYYRERQIHGWSRNKKIALIEGRNEDLPGLAKGYWRKKKDDDVFGNAPFDCFALRERCLSGYLLFEHSVC